MEFVRAARIELINVAIVMKLWYFKYLRNNFKDVSQSQDAAKAASHSEPPDLLPQLRKLLITALTSPPTLLQHMLISCW